MDKDQIHYKIPVRVTLPFSRPRRLQRCLKLAPVTPKRVNKVPDRAVKESTASPLFFSILLFVFSRHIPLSLSTLSFSNLST